MAKPIAVLLLLCMSVCAEKLIFQDESANLPPDASAKKSIFTLYETIEIPGTVLLPGRYVIRLAGPQTGGNLLQVFNAIEIWTADETRLVASAFSMPDYNLPPASKPLFAFFERGPNAPRAVREWYYPPENYGEQLVYPKSQAAEIAKTAKMGVLSIPSEAAKTVRPVEPLPEPSKPPEPVAKDTSAQQDRTHLRLVTKRIPGPVRPLQPIANLTPAPAVPAEKTVPEFIKPPEPVVKRAPEPELLRAPQPIAKVSPELKPVQSLVQIVSRMPEPQPVKPSAEPLVPVARAPTEPPRNPEPLLPRAKSQLSVTSDPSGAEVEINGVLVGRTPVTIGLEPVGLSFTVIVKKMGFRHWIMQSISAPGSSTLHAELSRMVYR
jgi:hypothetical protein